MTNDPHAERSLHVPPVGSLPVVHGPDPGCRVTVRELLVNAAKRPWYEYGGAIYAAPTPPPPEEPWDDEDHWNWLTGAVRVVEVEDPDAALIVAAVNALDDLVDALTYYAERRNHTTRSEDGLPMLWWNDSYDDAGPGARARAALARLDEVRNG